MIKKKFFANYRKYKCVIWEYFLPIHLQKKNIFRILLLYKTSIELVKKPACKTNLDENEIVLHSILLFFHLKAVE